MKELSIYLSSNTIVLRQRLIILFLFVFTFSARTQYLFTTSVNVQGNKTVVIEIVTTDIIINSSGGAPYNCPNGYNYDVAFDYSVKCFKNGNEVNFNKIYTLQGNFVCNGQSTFFNLPNSLGSGSTRTTGNSYSGSSNCNTVTVEDLICNTINFQVQMQGYNNSNLNTVAVQGGSNLPIELINFGADFYNGQVDLNWSTGSELNNDYFTIERSTNGMNWETVQTIDGAGNSSRVLNYGFTDFSPFSGISYYRLKQTDYDGASEIFKIVSVENKNLTELLAYPNPATSFTNLIGVVKNQELRIFSTMGVDLTGKVNISFLGVEKVRLDIRQLPKGMYYVRNGENSIQLLKQ